jgi:hypothetical protein
LINITDEIEPSTALSGTFTFPFCEILSRVSHADYSVLSLAELPIALRGASPKVLEVFLRVCKDDLAKL